MHSFLLVAHAWFRWVVLAALLWALLRAGHGYLTKRPFSSLDNALRHWTATIVHLQLVLGVVLYLKSPTAQYFWRSPQLAGGGEPAFFGAVHALLMLIAVVVITLGSALTKRRTTDAAQFRTQFLWFGLGVLIILAAIPWPGSTFDERPLFRSW